MNEFKSGEQLTAQRLNDAFAEAASDRSPRDYGSYSESDCSRIKVRLDYPYRAPLGAVVGIDYPIRSQTIDDTASMMRFLKEETIYSCSKNQYRHHNRIAILEQALRPGEIGWAVVSGVAKTFWHAQRPPYAGDETTTSSTTSTSDTTTSSTTTTSTEMAGDARVQLPIQSTNSHVDEYRHLAILSANFAVTPFTDETGREGSEHFFDEPGGEFHWHNRERPWWLVPFPRRIEADLNAEFEIKYPYSEDADPTGMNLVASSRGRSMGMSGYSVPEPTCTGTSTATCQDGKWYITTSTCNTGCSSWFSIENFAAAIDLGLTLPCTPSATISDIPCSSEYPYLDYKDAADVHELNAAGAWIDNGELDDGAVYNWLVGPVVMGTPEAPGVIDAEEAAEATRGDYWMPREFPDPYGPITSEDYGFVLRACADLTCTYKCNGSIWERVRGQTPWHLDEHWRCRCPDDFVGYIAGFDLPCGANTQPREITLGMIFDYVSTTTTTTTTTTTSTTTTTTAPPTTTTTSSTTTTSIQCTAEVYCGIGWIGLGATELGEWSDICPDGCPCPVGQTSATTNAQSLLDYAISGGTCPCADPDPGGIASSYRCDTGDGCQVYCIRNGPQNGRYISEGSCGGKCGGEPPPTTTSTTTSSTTSTTATSTTTTSSTTTTTDGSTSTTSSTTTTTQACGGNCLWGCTDNAWHILTNNCISGVNCECVSPVSACTTGDQQVTNCAEDGGGETSTTTSSTTTTTEPGSSSTSTTSSTTTTSEGSSSSTTSSTTTTSEAGSSSTTSSTTTTTAFCTGTCDWLCVDSAWQLSASTCGGGEACDCYSFDLESCSGTGATTSNNCRII